MTRCWPICAFSIGGLRSGVTRSAVSYLGAKNGAGVYQAIIGLMPPHDTYVEPFVGSGAILDRKEAAQRSIVLDLDREMIGRHADRRDVEAICGCGLEFLARLDVTAELGRVMIYCDPPYLAATRTSKARYRHEFNVAEHYYLGRSLDRLHQAGAKIIVSGYPHQMYEAIYGGWNTKQFQAMTRGGVRTEQVWFNFEPGDVHWHTFAGRNFTDRQRIKRKAERWAANYAKLPPAERQAVLAALLATDQDPA